MLNLLFGLVVLGLVVGAFMSLFYAFNFWPDEVRVRVGLIVVSLQVILFLSLWLPFVSDRLWLILSLLVAETLLLLTALVCAFSRKHQSRWWLVCSSTTFAVFSILSVVARAA